MPDAAELRAVLDTVTLPEHIHAKVIEDEPGNRQRFAPHVLVWADLARDICPRCHEPVTQDTSHRQPALQSDGDVNSLLQEDWCGQWLEPHWAIVKSTGPTGTVAPCRRGVRRKAAGGGCAPRRWAMRYAGCPSPKTTNTATSRAPTRISSTNSQPKEHL